MSARPNAPAHATANATVIRTPPAGGLSWLTCQLIAAGGFALVVVGSLLPWVTVQTIFGNVHVAGTSGDGVLALGLALFGCVAVLLGASRSWRISAMVAALATAALVAYDWGHVSDRAAKVSHDYLLASVGAGIYVCLSGATMAIAGSALMARHRR